MCENPSCSSRSHSYRGSCSALRSCLSVLFVLVLVSTPSSIVFAQNSVEASIARLNTHLQTLEQQVSELESLLSEHEQLSLEQESLLLTWRQRHEALEQSFTTLRNTFDAQVSSIEAERDAEAVRAARARQAGRVEGVAAGLSLAAVAVTLVLVLR